MKTIAITNIKLKGSGIDAMRGFRKDLGLPIHECKVLLDDLRTKKIYETNRNSDGEYLLHVIKKVCSFDIVKTKDEVIEETYQRKNKERLDAARFWFDTLSDENKVHFQTLQSNMIAS